MLIGILLVGGMRFHLVRCTFPILLHRRRVHKPKLLHTLLTPLALSIHPQDNVEPPNTLIHLPHQPHNKTLTDQLLRNNQIGLIHLIPKFLPRQLMHHVILLGMIQISPFQNGHIRPLRPVRPLPRRRAQVKKHAQRPIHRMAKQCQKPPLVILVVQFLPRELRLHRENQIARVTLDQSHLLRAKDARFDGGVDVHDLPILAAVGFEDHDFGIVIVAVAGVGAHAVGEGLAHALVEAFGGGSSRFGNVPKQSRLRLRIRPIHNTHQMMLRPRQQRARSRQIQRRKQRPTSIRAFLLTNVNIHFENVKDAQCEDDGTEQSLAIPGCCLRLR
mmetsp:Transcript_110/g.214  ORF Transcript_110/g.214 Transcript_110/m.214 type:complete len:330 (-) Transcript_110:271-1260(-)